MGAFETGQTLFAGVLEKLPESLRAQAKAVFEAAEAKDAMIVIGDSVLARSDYSKHMDAMRTEKEALEEQRRGLDRWYSVNKPALDEYVAYKDKLDILKAGGTIVPAGSDPDDPPPVPPRKPAGPVYDPEAVRKLTQEQIDAVAPDMIGISAWMTAKAIEHQAAFGEIPDLSGLVNEAVKQRQAGRSFTLDDAYRAKYGEKLTEREKTIHTKQIEDEVQKRLAEERTKQGSGHPFPLRTEASVLDALHPVPGTTNRPDPSQFSVDAAVAEYQRLTAARG